MVIRYKSFSQEIEYSALEGHPSLVSDQKEKEAASTSLAKKGGDRKEEASSAGGGGGGGDDAPKEEVSNMEYYGYPYPPQPAYWYDEHMYSHSHPVTVENHQVVYGMDHHNNPEPDLLPAEIFSDENPNACSVM